MNYYSTNNKATTATFKQALIKGQAKDKGLYIPEKIPMITKEKMKSFKKMSYHEIAFHIIKEFTDSEINNNILENMCKDAYTFKTPIQHVYENKYIIRLDQGPTASFKDYAAQMMARMMEYFLKNMNKNITILTATSGDTGSAVANAFHNKNNIKVIVIFPINEVSERQRKQMTTLGNNIKTIAINGKFDDAQTMVKKAFADPDLENCKLSSANSINIGRLIPQIVYYFYAYSKIANDNQNIVYTIPSGNFGNMTACVLAKKMGLPVSKIVVATNENDEFQNFMNTNSYKKISPSKNCMSSAMNVGHPSNLARLINLYGGKMDEKGEIIKMPEMCKIKEDIWTKSITDEETINTIKNVYNDYAIILEPHGAVAWKGYNDYITQIEKHKNELSVVLETAHPSKFPEFVKECTAVEPKIHPSINAVLNMKEKYIEMENDYYQFKEYLRYNNCG